MGWSCTGARLATGSLDHDVKVWAVDAAGAVAGSKAGAGHQPKTEVELKGHTDVVEQLVWHPSSGDRLASAGGDKTVRVWDVRAGKCALNCPTAGENINIAWSPDGHTVAVGNRDDLISFIDLRTGKVAKTSKFFFEVNEIVWNPAGDLLLLTTGLGTVEVMSYPSVQPLHSLSGHTAGCYCIAYQPGGQHFAVGGADALVSVWDAEEMACVRTVPRLEKPISTLGFSYDGRYLAAGSSENVIDVSETATGKLVHHIQARVVQLSSLAWSPKHILLAYAGEDRGYEGVVKIYGYPQT